MELGQPIDLGASGVTKRLDAFRRHHTLGGKTLLDLGCGNGAYTEVLAKTFGHVEAVDVLETHVDAFRLRLRSLEVRDRVHVQCMSAESLNFPSASFDAVTCIEVLEHVTSVSDTLAEVRRVLRPGGVFLVTVPNRLFPIETHSVRVGRRRFPGKRLPGLPYIPPLHARVSEARTYTSWSLRRQLAGAGFCEVATDYVMPPFDRWTAGRKYLKPLSDRLEQTPFRVFGVSVVGVYLSP